MVGPVAVDRVLGQGALPPGVDAAHAVNVEVDVQVDEAAAPDLMGMRRLFQILLAVIPGPDAQGLAPVDPERFLPV